MEGKIIKGVSGFYYVHTAESGTYECKAKGIFRSQNRKPLIGDCVEIAVLDEKEKKGNVIEIYPRKNALFRPAVANIDQALVIFAAAQPEPNLNLLDRFLAVMRFQNVPAAVCFNKTDLVSEEVKNNLADIYSGLGIPVLFVSAKEGTGIDALSGLLQGKTSAVAGPSGAGKSSIVNLVQQEEQMETGAVSKKIGRGKNTTRHARLLCAGGDAYIMDTPGFGSLELQKLTAKGLWSCYPEFLPFEPSCRFTGCSHICEPGCGVREALKEGKIHRQRYETYTALYQELKEAQKQRKKNI